MTSNRPNWDEYFLDIASVVRTRSRDPNTQHGCVLVDAQHRIVGTGYNSFIKEVDDSKLPTTRPPAEGANHLNNKYVWMIHSEANALMNCVGDPVTAYVTGKCCTHCLQLLWQRGIKRVVMHNVTGWQKDEKESDQWNMIVELTGLKTVFINRKFIN